MPSARPVFRPRLYVRIAWETAGVGVYSSPVAIMTSTPLAASTSSALATAGTERACVSMPRNNGPSIFCSRPVQTNGLTDGQDMPLVESLFERGTAVSRGAKRDPLRRHRGVGRLGIIGRDKSGHINQHGWFGRLSRKRAYLHGFLVKCRGDLCARVSINLWKGLLDGCFRESPTSFSRFPLLLLLPPGHRTSLHRGQVRGAISETLQRVHVPHPLCP